MPLHKGGKKAVQYNIKELFRANKYRSKKRSRKQITAISYKAARGN